ncbi:unnamed protein product [Paramecium primaurelia]|uniref:Prefoldin subunit 5 n=1 Tax=Paramecium primaurelia TaxID=5886 RepID=A0A8S1N044_PARPR|nr:unnamed protein product [Paramecium primaurelia]
MSQQQEEQKAIPLDKLTPQQLLQIKKQIEEEVQQLTQSLSQFRIANAKYEESKVILKRLDQTPKDNDLLVPITASLYVPGRLINPQSIMIDYGTGYFVERNTEQGSHFCDRKLQLLKESQDKLSNIINQKKQFMDKLNIELQKRVMQVQQIQQQQQQQKK